MKSSQEDTTKYVLFLDILGFKKRLKVLNQKGAKRFISRFSSTVYRQWKEYEKFDNGLEGYIFSDSLIISTKDASPESLVDLLKIAKDICQKELSENRYLMRGGLEKGEYDKLKAIELNTLEKGLVVGQAYIDAYLLEGSLKTTSIILSEKVYEDARNLNQKDFSISEELVGAKNSYVFNYLGHDFLLDRQILEKFTEQAIKSKWLPHYYNGLYFSLKNEKTEKVDQVFTKIISTINGSEPSEHKSDLDCFEKKASAKGVVFGAQNEFSRYFRSKL